ncbi:SDR family NAD(P)-dependent oxidoreductase [Nocardia niigatensis]|uniref:SDR family NAD(P)-dependent oxidoreductase n=1 Tax=Nocardia niigatensis TaxID=209249 RepID=UPI0002D7570B|nr:SDR family NAD(P)-dependent oxidoreductase [Nocardia niigatensis]
MSKPSAPVFDRLLDRTVVLGYSRPGYRLRSRHWQPLPGGALRDRTALITGANSGIGLAIATGLARLGARVTLVVRDRARGAAAAARIADAVPGAVPRIEHCDISDLAGVREFAAGIAERIDRIDVLVHNAGTLPAVRTESPQGHELCVATHVLGPLLATESLAPLLARAPAPRVILMSSGGMYTQALHPEDFEYRASPYRGATAYARSKRMQVALTPILADRYAPQGISVHCMHPGWVDTPGIAAALPRFRGLTGPLLRTPAQGADTAIWLAATDVPSGRLWHDRRARPAHYLPCTQESAADRERLWQYCAAATGLTAR